MSVEDYFSEQDRQQILSSIKEAEKNTSGEIRLFIEKKCEGNVLDRAAYIFHEIGMDRTQEKNGVLFYMAFDSHKFAILGDSGINAKVPEDFWHEIKMIMQQHFVDGNFVKGLKEGIRLSGHALSLHFPYSKSDKNELPDDIIFGKGKA
ncbi:MAG: TPM domain-containing protein [Bacteroidetes bacterium]|nr:MAG: TPM domain-containing protein [Bacteroidota bacterium]REK06511.1 MAG: TPM domain-containing protein [Bacteroidota bacterium]REK33277.1 MAG: TPM domain-containing protein [Bacteroidota bacterium]REK49677.1 MAG: TPM domain-containing protein [Bacteroidota bacterium]